MHITQWSSAAPQFQAATGVLGTGCPWLRGDYGTMLDKLTRCNYPFMFPSHSFSKAPCSPSLHFPICGSTLRSPVPGSRALSLLVPRRSAKVFADATVANRGQHHASIHPEWLPWTGPVHPCGLWNLGDGFFFFILNMFFLVRSPFGGFLLPICG